MDAEDALDPEHQDDPMTLDDAHLSDHKEEISKEDTSASGGIVDTANVCDEKVKTSPIYDNDSGESDPVKNKRKKKSEPDTETGLRRSARPKRKPLW